MYLGTQSNGRLKFNSKAASQEPPYIARFKAPDAYNVYWQGRISRFIPRHTTQGTQTGHTRILTI